MFQLKPSLQESDAAVIREIARFWGVDVQRITQPEEQQKALLDLMLQPENAATIWEKLNDDQRGVLQTLLSAQQMRMPIRMYEALHGETRKMGRGQIERENPLNNPQSIAEGLFYRGLTFTGFVKNEGGAMNQFVYIPPDLAAVLPAHKTSYDDLEPLEPVPGMADPGEPVRLEPIDAEFLEDILPADTTIVDDVASLLGYFQVRGGEIEDDELSDHDIDHLLPLMMNDDEDRLTFIFEVSVSAQLLDTEDGLVRPRRAETKRWLESSRSNQLKALADAWMESAIYRELWHVPGLYPEQAAYDPTIARTAIINFIKDFTPLGEWWSIDDFITQVKAYEPDFQRPGSEYESWYIRNEGGEFLTGFESWDAVDGATLEFILTEPMHWLGLVDLAEDAVRLNGYGRVFVSGEAWPNPQEPTEAIDVAQDGTLQVSRRVPRMDRFQAMRFTSWVAAADDENPFIYKLSMEGIQQASEQGITTDHISAFLTRMLNVEQLPAPLVNLLNTWQSGPQTRVTMETLLVLRTTAPETLDYIMDTPALRRYCGARLGDMAVSVRKNQWEALRDALAEKGIQLENLSS